MNEIIICQSMSIKDCRLILNYIGQVVFERNADQPSIQINTSSFDAGIYFIEIRNAEGVSVVKRLSIN
jgi:hypothetical protein